MMHVCERDRVLLALQAQGVVEAASDRSMQPCVCHIYCSMHEKADAFTALTRANALMVCACHEALHQHLFMSSASVPVKDGTCTAAAL